MKSLPFLTSKDNEVSDDLFDVITEGILSDAISADQEPIGEENLGWVQVPHGNPSPKSTTSPRRLDTGPDSGTWDYLRINYGEQSGGSHGKDANVPNDVMYPNQPHELLEGALFDPRTGLPLPQVATVVENITTNYDYRLADANPGNAVDWGIEQQIIDYQKRRLRQFSICRRIVGIILILIGIALLIFSAVQTSRHVKAYSAWSKSGLPPFNGNPTDPKNTLPEVDPSKSKVDPNLAPENKPLPKPREKKKEEVPKKPSDQKPSSDTEPEPEKPKVVINKDYITRHAEKYRKNILEEDEEEDPLYHHGKRPGVVGEEEISGTLINRAKQVGIENKNLVLLQNNDEFLEKINQELQAVDFAGAGEEKFAEWGALFCLLNLKLFTRITKELLDSTSTSNTRAKLFFGVPVTQDFQLRSPGWPYRVLIHAASNLLVSHMRSEHRTLLMKTLKEGKMLLEGDPPLVGIEIEKGRSGWLYLDPYAGSEKKYVEKENLDQYGLEYYKKIIVSLIRQFLEAVSKSKAHKGMSRMTIRIDRRIFLLVMPSCPIELIMSDKYLSESEWELVQKILNWEQSAVDPANVSDEVMYSNSEEAVDAYNRYVLLFCSRFFWMTLLEVLKDEYKSAVTSWIPTLRDAKPGDRFEVFQELFMSTSPGEFLVSCKFAGLAVYTPPQLVPLTERLVSDLILGKPHTTEDLQSIVTLVTEGFKFNENWMERAKKGEPGGYENIPPVEAEHDSWYMSPTRYHTRKSSGAAANVVPVVDPSSSDEAAVSEREPSAPSE